MRGPVNDQQHSLIWAGSYTKKIRDLPDWDQHMFDRIWHLFSHYQNIFCVMFNVISPAVLFPPNCLFSDFEAWSIVSFVHEGRVTLACGLCFLVNISHMITVNVTSKRAFVLWNDVNSIYVCVVAMLSRILKWIQWIRRTDTWNMSLHLVSWPTDSCSCCSSLAS